MKRKSGRTSAISLGSKTFEGAAAGHTRACISRKSVPSVRNLREEPAGQGPFPTTRS